MVSRRRFSEWLGHWTGRLAILSRRYLTVARWIFVPVAIAFLLYFAWSTRDSLIDMITSGKPSRLAAAVLAWSLMYLLAPLLSLMVFRGQGRVLTYLTAARIHISYLPARYVPGGIWHTVGRVAAFRQLGFGRLDIAVFVFLENILAVGVAFVIGGSLVAWYHNLEGWGLVAAIAAAGGLALLLVCPYALSHRVLKGHTNLKIRNYFAGVAVVALGWCVGAAAFVLYVSAFPSLDLPTSVLETGGTYLFSWGVGYAAVFAPQGIGVFEVVAADLLATSASVKGIAALLVGFRLVIMLADGLVWGALQVLRPFRHHLHKSGTSAANDS